jgi:Rne/Rng family ribonuclease
MRGTRPFILPPVERIAVAAPPGQKLAAEFRGGQIWGLHWQWLDDPDPAGSLWRIRITRLVPALKGAFAAIGSGADDTGFLDLSDTKRPPHEGQVLIAQATRAPEDGKRLTLKPAARLVGRYLVYSPGRPGLAASRQLRDKETARQLQGLLRSHMQDGEGVIVRAAAAPMLAAPEPILAELDRHRATWAATQNTDGLGQIAPPPPLWEQILIERTGTGPLEITADSDAAYAGMRAAIARWATAEPVTLTRDQDKVFTGSSAMEALEACMAEQTPLLDGGSLWIQPSRACWTIDVDTAGLRLRTPEDRLAVNRAAAVEIARQVRLRRIGGAVVIDFLRLATKDQRLAVAADLRAAFAEDSASLQFNRDFDAVGLYSFSRQRLGQTLLQGQRLPLLRAAEDYVRQGRATAAGRVALVLAPAAAAQLAGMTETIATATATLGYAPIILQDESFARDAYLIRPI